MKFFTNFRFTILLVAMFVLNVTRTASAGMPQHPVLLNLIGTGALIVAIFALCVERQSRTVSLFIGMPAIALLLLHNLVTGDTELLVSNTGRAVSVLFLLFTIAVILRTLVTQPSVTGDSIAGAFCGYALIGAAFAEVYCLLETLVPGSFHAAEAPANWSENPAMRWYLLEYFSFTTMTTLGFGDVLPTSPLSRCLTVWEAICGQFYLAVLVAGLVNLRGANAISSANASSTTTLHPPQNR